MTKNSKRPKPGEMVVLTGLPPGFLNDLPKEDRLAISRVIGKRIALKGFDQDGRAALKFAEENGTIHFIYVSPTFIRRAE
jgi:hypothetical protein